MRIIYALLLFLTWQSVAVSMENVFYILHDNREQAISEIEKQANLTDILIAQAYRINEIGIVTGSIDEDIVDVAKRHSIKLFALVTNAQYDSKMAHLFLVNPTAQQKALNTLLTECKKNNIAGIQLDFEMIRLADKMALTQFYRMAAELFHKNGLMVSFAIAPTVMDHHFPSAYQKKLYEIWQGAYDIQQLGELSDFVTIMSYDQHAAGTTPGPIASFPWDEQVIKHALEHIPAEKISLGIPTYSGLWYMGTDNAGKISVHYDAISFKTLMFILDKYKPNIQWDSISKVNYTLYDLNGLNRYIFIENAKSFAAKYDLAKTYHLRGISVFRLGIEDPAIWDVLKHKPWWQFW